MKPDLRAALVVFLSLTGLAACNSGGGGGGGGSSTPPPVVTPPVVEIEYFAANDGVNGYELWQSDGTAAGTVLLKDIKPGAGGSGPYLFRLLNGAMVFFANDGATGYELWKTDGTAAGTAQVKDMCPGSCDGWVD